MSPARSIPEDQVRGAMERLLQGRSLLSDGSLTVENLALEAAVSRQTLYRAHRLLLDEFRKSVARLEATGRHADQRTEREHRLRSEVAVAEERAEKYRTEATQWQARAERLASQVALLSAQNEALRSGVQGTVRALRGSQRQ